MTRIEELRDQVRDLQDQVEDTLPSLRELNRLFTSYLALGKRFGLPEPIVDAMRLMEQQIIIVQTLYRNIMLLYTASGPVGWLIGGAGLVMGGIMLADQMSLQRPRY